MSPAMSYTQSVGQYVTSGKFLYPAIIFAFLYVSSIGVYRIFLSPIANIPGPKLAALTFWVETYYDILHKGGGQFHFQIHKWHNIYGPIIRINPNEVHVNDPEYYETVYHTSKPLDKLEHFQWRFDTPLATFSTTQHELHRTRRMALAPFFSKKRVMEFAPCIYDRIDKLTARLEHDFMNTGRILVLSDMWACVISDMVTSFAFNHSYQLVDEPDFQNPFIKAVKMFGDMVHFTTQFPWLLKLAHCFPDYVVATVIPPTQYIFNFRKTMRDRIMEAQQRIESHDSKAKANPILFDEILKSDLPVEEKSLARLGDEALGVTAAGTETTRWVLSVACFYILNDAGIQNRLLEELKEAIPDPEIIPSLSVLEQLPYLTACIQEGIRLAYGGVSRSPRVSPNETLRYGTWEIPPGTPVSIETYTMHHNEDIFPDSFSFVPDRWLDSPVGPDGAKRLTRYLTSFGKGTRVCIGMTLAYAELYIALAAVLRRFTFTLYATDKSDVECHYAVLNSRPKRSSKGVRVRVHRA